MPRQMTKSQQSHQCTIWNYAGFRLQRILIRSMASAGRYQNGRREQRWLSVLAAACRGLVVDLWAFLLGKKVSTAVVATACGKVVHSSILQLRRARARWHGGVRGGILRYE